MGLREGQQPDQLGLLLYHHDVLSLVRFYKAVFDATETHRFGSGAQAVGVKLRDSHLTIVRSSVVRSGSIGAVMVAYVHNVDWATEHARALGAKFVRFLGSADGMPAIGTVLGDHAARLLDPAGYLWEVRTWCETVTAQEAVTRARLVADHARGRL